MSPPSELAEAPHDAPRSGRAPRWSSTRLVIGAVVVALVPFVVATVRAIQGGWVPTGDNGLIAVRVHDVFSAHPPLLYTWSSSSLTAPVDFNHPGPLLFDALAIPTAVSRWSGLLVGVALLNAAAVVGIVIAAFRRGGALLAGAAVAVAAALCWSMGSELLFDPWSPNSLLLPFFLFLFLAWCVAAGDLVVLPWLAGVGSLLLATNLGFGLLVPAIAVVAIGGLVLALRRDRRADGADGADVDRTRPVRRVLLVTAVVFVLCWIQPIVEQFTSSGEGNFTRIARGLTSGGTVLGTREGIARFAGATVTWWLPWTMRAGSLVLSSTALAAFGVVIVALVLAACAWVGRRRHDREVVAVVAVAAVAAAAGLVSAIRTPTAIFGGLISYQTRWLWALAAFMTFTVVVTVLRRLVRDPRLVRPVVAGFALVTVAVALANLPTRRNGSDAPDWTMPIARDLNHQLGGLGRGTLYVDWRGEPFSQYYGSAVIAELNRRGVPFVVTDAVLVRSLGSHRRFNGHNATAELRVRTGDDAYVPPPGGHRVALHEDLTVAERRELASLKQQVRSYLRANGLQLTPKGKAAFARLAAAGSKLSPPTTPTSPPSSSATSPTASAGAAGASAFDPDALLANRAFVNMIDQGYLALSGRWIEVFYRYAQLQAQRDTRTVGVFVGPVLPPGATGASGS